MSLINLNSTNQDPAEFTNRCVILRLAPNTSLRVLGYGINVKDAAKNQIGIASGADTMTFCYDNPIATPIKEELALRNVVLKIPSGNYPIGGTELCKVMTREANRQLADGKLPGFCGDSIGGGTIETDGCAFKMVAGDVEFTQHVQIQPEAIESLWGAYGSTHNTSKNTYVINNGGGSSTIETPVVEDNYSSYYDNDYVYFPVIPRQVGGIPDKTQINLAVPTEARTQYNLGGGTAASDTPEKYLCSGGYVYHPATKQFQLDKTPSTRDDWARGTTDVWFNHGWKLYKTAGGRMSFKVLRGTPNPVGGRGEVVEVPTAPAFFPLPTPESAANGLWDATFSMRVVANNIPASNVATGYVSQLWFSSNNPAVVAPILVDEYEITGQDGENPMLLSDRLNNCYKVLSPGTGVVGDVQSVKIQASTGKGQGNGAGVLPAYNFSVQTDMYAFGNRFEEGLVGVDAAENGELRTAAASANAGQALGFDQPEFQLIANNTSVGTGWTASEALGSNANDVYDQNQTILFQIPNLPIYGRLGATGDVAPVVAWGRLKSVYNGDTETGAYWYNFPVPPRIDLNNDAEIVMNELNVRITDESGKKIDFLDPHTSLLVEMSPNPPSSVRPHGSR